MEKIFISGILKAIFSFKKVRGMLKLKAKSVGPHKNPTLHLSNALFTFAKEGNVQSLKALLTGEDAVDPMVTDKHGVTALHVAAASGQIEAVELLLTKLSPDVKDKQNNTPLHSAALCKDHEKGTEITRLLLAKLPPHFLLHTLINHKKSHPLQHCRVHWK